MLMTLLAASCSRILTNMFLATQENKKFLQSSNSRKKEETKFQAAQRPTPHSIIAWLTFKII